MARKGDIVSPRKELDDIADELGLVRYPKESKALLYSRILDRANVLWRLALSEEQSDQARKKWPRSE